MNYGFVFALHKSPTYILKAFVCISFGLHFKNNVGVHIVHCKTSR